ncbi:hypothetical protein [Azospirillum sp.]|uniref:hypothetical protein n=1 Tax=Azospirillum sp. TaxID=34012 RepID=UPI002D4073D8|nr:hypothetical protein [Azospirillum sp.]HYF87071.1 hypothetical protein [Azospirillum sp.]
MLLGILGITGTFWIDVRLGSVTLEAVPLIGGGLALYKVIRTADEPPVKPGR